MNYTDRLSNVFPEITNDPLWRMEVYRLSVFLGELAWIDTDKLIKDPRMLKLSDQLYSAVGSISANIAESYSKASKKDQARFYEYSLGSAREARDWYFKARHILGNEVALHRIRLLVQIIRPLLKLVPEFRGRKIAKEQAEYLPYTLESLLENMPLPQ
jgi:four helix bundle protein